MKQIIAKETEKQYYIESNDITKITKKHYKSKQEKNIGNYMKMKKIQRQNMEEIDTIIYLKKINED